LYGATRKTYEELTRIPGSYDRCMRGIRLLLERGLPLKLKTVPTTVNFHEVYEMKRMAEEDFGVQFKFDPLVNPRTDCSQSPLNVRLTPEQVVALEFRDPVRRSEYKKMVELELAQPAQQESSRKYTCGGGQNGCAVDPGGRMTICVLSLQDGYEFREGSFIEGWTTRLAEIRDSKRTRETKCSRCRIQSLCSMCPANGELENKDAESPVEFLCEVAHLRAFTLGLEVPEHGDCEYCDDEAHHATLLSTATRVNDLVQENSSLSPLAQVTSLLPVLQIAGGCSTGGCASCGTFGK